MRFSKVLAGVEVLQRLARLSLFGDKRPFGCSLAATGRCNLKCIHCYERRRRKEKVGELSLEGMRELCEVLFDKGMRHCTITDGEPLLDRASIEKCGAIVDAFWATYIVTNGTKELPDFSATYIVSLDGPRKIHDTLRGAGVFDSIKRNTMRAPHDDLYALCTLNSLNRLYIRDTVNAARNLGVKGIMFNWYNPLKAEDPLWVPFPQRNQDIDIILGIRDELGGFVLNTAWELDILRSPKWAKDCPAQWIVSHDAAGRVKKPCIFQDPKMCGRCGCHVFLALKEAVRGRPSIEARLMLNFVKKWWLREGALARLEIPKSLDRISVRLPR
jgi:hypothetical protein